MFKIFDFEYANPEFFWLLLVLIPITAWYLFAQKRNNASVTTSNTKVFERIERTWKYYFRHLLFVFRILAIVFLVIALARPQSTDNWSNSTTYGIDIVLAMDVSTSMLAQDLRPDRLEASKDVAMEFINSRPYDRIGLVVFSGESFTQCPLTTDHTVLLNLLKDVKTGIIEDGTAIGMGLANAVTRLKDSKSVSKTIILLTDGVNNRGDIDPLTAAEIAQTFKIRVYTVGVGTEGMAPYPFQTPFGIQMQSVEVHIDEDILKEISRLTGGKYFRATDNKKLKEIYKEIDRLEKSRIEVREYSKKNEEALPFMLIAGLLILLEIIFKYTIFRSIP